MGLVTPAWAAIWSIEAPGPSRLITVMADSIRWARWVDRRVRRSVSSSEVVTRSDRRDRGMLPMVTLLSVTVNPRPHLVLDARPQTPDRLDTDRHAPGPRPA